MEKLLDTQCCIAGGGPAGMMLGYLLARAGIQVVVLEKHADFNRDFRGDTIHPSTFQLMDDLGLLQQFLKVPHQEIKHLSGYFNEKPYNIVDFTHLRYPAGLMPQWDFLNFLQTQASQYSTMNLLMNTEALDVVMDKNRVTGVIAKSGNDTIRINSDLIIGADGRHSTIRDRAGLKVITTGVPIDVLWFRIPEKPSDPQQSLGRMNKGRVMVLLNRVDYWQCAYIIEKGSYPAIQKKGIQAFRQEIATATPFLADRVEELNWDNIKLLSVAIDHLDKWYTDGLLCIGDSAHAMSPVGGVGINLALQDAVATANILYRPLLERRKITAEMLQQVQKRRELPTRLIQKIQETLHKGMEARFHNHNGNAPLFIRVLNRIALLQRIPARLVGMGFRPERIRINFKN